MIHNPQSIKSTWSGVFSLTSPLASPWRSWTFCCRCMWSALSSPSPLSSSLSQSWRSCAGSSICSGPAAKVSPGHLMPHFLTSHLRSTYKNRLVFSDCLCCMANWTAERSEVERRREKDTQKKKGLHLKVFYLCALGSSRLTSPVYWGLCDLNAALRLHYFAMTPSDRWQTHTTLICLWLTYS